MSDRPARIAQDAWVTRVLGITPGSGGGDAARDFARRLADLMARGKAALAGPLGQDLKLKLSEAGVFGRKQDYAAANRLLDEAERLMAVGAPPAPGPDPAQAAFVKAGATWQRIRQQAEAGIKQLEQAILHECADEPDFDVISGNTRMLYAALDYMGGNLTDKLAAARAAAPAALRGLRDEAREIIDGYLAYIAQDELLRDIDDNGFVEVSVGTMLTEQLTAIDRELKALKLA
ncbi:MAG: hypothetical protein KGI51_00530 [Rhodospirillales bacterium]|nr:hypothetical protein [Rhodospirillales bacterium]